MAWYSRSQLRRQAWSYTRSHLGKFVLENGTLGRNPAGAQCVNVPNGYWMELHLPAIDGNAKQWDGYQDLFRRCIRPKGPHSAQAGDCLVLLPQEGVDPDGHVCIVLDATKHPWLTLDQNWPVGSPVQLAEHDYGTVASLIRVR